MNNNTITTKKNILFVGAYPPPYGGIASHLYNVLPQLVKRGYDVISLTNSSKDKIIVTSGMKNIYYNRKNYILRTFLPSLITFISSLNIKQDLSWWEFFKVTCFSHVVLDVIKKEKIEIVFIYDNYNGLIVPVLKKCLKDSVPIGLMIFGDFYLYTDKYLSIKEYFKRIFIECDVIFSSSQYCADSISNVLGYNFPVRVVYVGVDHNEYKPQKDNETIRAGIELPQDSIVFLFLGRMSKSMGVDFLLQVADRLLSLHRKVYLILAGAKGEYSESVKILSERESRVKFFQDVPFEKTMDLYAASDILLSPTMERHACMGVSIKEAMAFGKPVIASISGGIPEAIEDRINGYLVPIEGGKLNSDIFLERAKKLIYDKELRRMMGEAGREKLLRMFTNDITTEEYLKIIRELSHKSI
jgi:hypothetical protein